MHCPFCHHEDTQVIDTRTSEEGDITRRRRRCSHCDKRFTTYERIELAMPVIVKKNGSRTEFESAKLRGSLMLALRKRPVSADAVDAALGDGGTRRGGAQDEHARHRAGGVDLTARVEG